MLKIVDAADAEKAYIRNPRFVGYSVKTGCAMYLIVVRPKIGCIIKVVAKLKPKKNTIENVSLRLSRKADVQMISNQVLKVAGGNRMPRKIINKKI